MECVPTNGCCAPTLNPKNSRISDQQGFTSSITEKSTATMPYRCSDAVMHHGPPLPPPLTKKIPFHISYFIYDTEGGCLTRTVISVTAFISVNTRQQTHLYLVSLLEYCTGFLGIIDGSPSRYGKSIDHAFVGGKNCAWHYPSVHLVFYKGVLTLSGGRNPEETRIQPFKEQSKPRGSRTVAIPSSRKQISRWWAR